MSSRGAKITNGHVTTDEYVTLKMHLDAKVLIGATTSQHGLPDFAHTPGSTYIKENPDGTFRELRVYDENGRLLMEIGYHAEEKLTGNRHEKVLHFHTFDSELNRFMGGRLSEKENSEIYFQFKKYLEGYGL